MAGDGLDRLIGEGRIAAGSRVDLARSGIGVAVRAGAARPDLSSADALIRAITQAKSVAHSSSASGVYLKGLFRRLGLTDTLGDRIRQVEGEPVGAVVARGEVEIGFQQVSELLPVPASTSSARCRPSCSTTRCSQPASRRRAREPDAARALIAYLTAPAAAPIIRQSGMEPA